MELLLVLCLCISTWTGKTLGDENGLITVNVSQGKDAILPCSPTTKEDLSFKSFKWRKDGQNVFYYDAGNHYNDGLDGQGPQFKGRVSFFQDQLRSGDASIQIQNVTIQDSGIYSCEISGLNSGIQTFNIKLVVDVPTLNATEGSHVMLQCFPSGKIDLTHQMFDWKKDDTQEVFLYDNGSHYNNGKSGQHKNFKNRVEFFQDQLQFGNASIRIKNAKRNDSGNYICKFPKLQPPGQMFYMKLVVHVCPKPRLSTKKTADGIRVICSVPDVSKVKMEMELHNSDNKSVGQLLDNGTSQNTQYFIFSVTKEGHYRCLVKQKEICHQIYSEEVFVPISGVVTVTVSQGSDVILPCSATTKENLSFKSFKWRKDGQNVFHYDAGIHYNDGLQGQDPQFKDRVSFFQNQLRSGDASIQIQTVTIQDSGIYSCEISGLNSGSQTFNIKLVNVLPHRTKEGSDVILPCSPSGKIDLTYQVFDWKKNDTQEVFLYDNGIHYNNGKSGQHENFKNRVEFFQDQLQFGNASIRIKNAKRNDSGIYSCKFPKLQPGQMFYMKLDVQCATLKDRTQDRSDVCPKPRLSTKKTADGIRVICSVPDVSKVEMEMEMELHNSDNKSVGQLVDDGTSQNTQYFIFSVTKEGDYRCLVKQKEICHQIYSEEVFAPISGDDKGLSPGYVAVIVIVVIVAVAVILATIVTRTVHCPRCKHIRSSGDRTNDVANSEGELHHLKDQKDSELTNET